jgi:uncharacterized membrane protein (UPF0127 family)
MHFMSIPIDVVFLCVIHAKEGERKVVTSVHGNVRPWKLLPLGDGKAHEALELPVGSIVRLGILPGDELCIG